MQNSPPPPPHENYCYTVCSRHLGNLRNLIKILLTNLWITPTSKLYNNMIVDMYSQPIAKLKG